jgi:hypothetical protein
MVGAGASGLKLGHRCPKRNTTRYNAVGKIDLPAAFSFRSLSLTAIEKKDPAFETMNLFSSSRASR